MPDFTFDRVTPHELDFRRWLAPYVGKPVAALEIGSAEGRWALWVLDNILTHPSAGLTCVDPMTWPPTLERFNANTATARAAGKLQLIRCCSAAAINALASCRFSLIYVDGDHTAPGAYLDLAICWACLADGGTLILDDLKLDGKRDGGPGVAFLRFCQSVPFRATIEITDTAWGQVCLVKQ